MRRRSRADASVKSQRRKPAAQRNGRKAKKTRPRNSSAADQESEAAQLASELAAIKEILQLISNPPCNFAAVLQSVAERAAHICPEDVMSLLSEYHTAIGTIINKYSGTLERYAGDGVMVIFNDPVLVENPALQAVLMALEMRTAIETLMAKWRSLGHDIGFGIGIAHGFATLGTIGFEGRRDYAAIGTVSNVASQLCDEAKPGQIIVSPRVMLAVDKAVTVESVGEFALKGIRRPMMAYNVISSRN
jgi:class 3 adenylate cyclase